MLSHNAHEIAVQLDAHGAAAERAFFAEAARLAQEVARRMRERAPKWRSTLTNSIAVSMPAPMTWEVRPGVGHGSGVADRQRCRFWHCRWPGHGRCAAGCGGHRDESAGQEDAR